MLHEETHTDRVAAALAVALALPVSNLITGAPQVKLGGTGADPALAKIVPVLEKKCTNCHSTAGRIPFYGKLPVARGIIEKDIRRGTRFSTGRGAGPGGGAGDGPGQDGADHPAR